MKWNPNDLSPAQVENGWRLLDADEVKDHRRYTDVQYWQADRKRWYGNGDYVALHGILKYTIRTKHPRNQQKYKDEN